MSSKTLKKTPSSRHSKTVKFNTPIDNVYKQYPVKKIKYTRKSSVSPNRVKLYTIPEEENETDSASPEITYIKRSDNAGREKLNVKKSPSPKKAPKSIFRFLNLFSSTKKNKNKTKKDKNRL